MHQEFPQWAYGPGGAADVFNSADEIPAGWVDHPSKVKGAADTSDSGVKTPIASANGSVSEAKVERFCDADFLSYYGCFSRGEHSSAREGS
jgi:hypothetical protein